MQLLVGVRALTTPRLKHSATKPLHLSVSCEGVRSQSVAIVGGGLAGLSTAFHLLKKDPDTSITIVDTKSPGLGGASSVAGGFLHPLSPKGKLVHLGLEGLQATNEMLDAASKMAPNSVLKHEIYRVATSDNHVQQLTKTAETLPDIAEWMHPKILPWECEANVLGALRLHSGCKVVHVPSYLKGLWRVVESSGTKQANWIEINPSSPEFSWVKQLNEVDTVVLAAGSGLFDDLASSSNLPIQLVGGQSIEMTLGASTLEHALLCGKYISPLMANNKVLIGATHEFQEVPLGEEEVISELRERSRSFASDLWTGATIDRVTSGVRVQSNRGKYGRMPLVGKYSTSYHSNAWIFTGLSSRGLLLHGVFGEILASKILGVDSEYSHPELDWWQNR